MGYELIQVLTEWLDAFRYGEFEAGWTEMVGFNVFRSAEALDITRPPAPGHFGEI
jgi:hypothetical protein